MPMTVAPAFAHRDRDAAGAAAQLEDRADDACSPTLSAEARRAEVEARSAKADQNAMSRRPTVCAFSQS